MVKLSIKERLDLIKSVGEEIVTEQELIELLEKKENFIAYDGFEPSGKIHIAQGLLRAININKMTKAGAKFKMLVADWHAWANNKMGGDLEKIQIVGKYFIEVWKSCDLDIKNVEFVWASDLLNNKEYWKTVMQIARNSTLNRILRTTQIMGRSEKDILQASHILYPCMQAADIFHLKADICQLGLDQRKVNVLAREIGEKIGFYKPIIVSHHMLLGLQQIKTEEKDVVERTIELKMSKSKPDTAIFMTDTKEDIERKLNKAYCPERQVTENPVLEYFKYIIFEKFDKIEINRPEKFGGTLKIENYEKLTKLYEEGKIHPLDLKKSSAFYINELIKPTREYFEKNIEAKKLKEKVDSFEITR
ncbi:MAG: tyrosine--tRNA ligase [Candidatus Woesearchaeota archaeon]